MQTSQPTKFIGGVAVVRITPISNVILSANDITNEKVLLRNSELIETVEILEDRSSYSEEELIKDGISFVRHSLKMVLRRDVGLSLRSSLSTKYMNGVVAIVTTHAKEKLLVGFTTKFEIEQPLRVVASGFETGISPKDYPLFAVTLQCEDTSYATYIE